MNSTRNIAVEPGELRRDDIPLIFLKPLLIPRSLYLERYISLKVCVNWNSTPSLVWSHFVVGGRSKEVLK